MLDLLLNHRYPNIVPWDSRWSETVWGRSVPERLSDYCFDLIVSSPRSALENLALDVSLQQSVAQAQRPAVVWIWDWAERAVVLGSYQSVRNEIEIEGMKQHGFTFVRRMSGGGAMVVEPERTITFSLILPEAAVEGLSYVQSFAYLDRWIIRALRTLGIPATYKPINDIASPVAKIGGAAQARRWGTVLHHVTMAYDFDPVLLTGLLRLGKPKPNEKGTASAEKQVSPISMYTDMSQSTFRQYLAHAFRQMYPVQDSDFTGKERDAAQRLIEGKLGTKEWLWRVE